MDRLMELFIRDSKKYISQAINSLISFEKNPENISEIDSAFRALHSIKTESSYLQLDKIKDVSHRIENELESLRGSSNSIDSERCDILIKEIEKLSEIINLEIEKSGVVSLPQTSEVSEISDGFDLIEIDLEEEIESEEEYYPLEDNEKIVDETDFDRIIEEESVVSSSISASDIIRESDNEDVSSIIDSSLTHERDNIPDDLRDEIRKEFDDFELQLLSESMKRGEKLYRILCEISRDSVMKYPRLYLVVNNLELKTNLIKTFPGIEDLSKGDFTRIKIYITTKKGYKEIFNIVDVDEIDNIQIVNLPFSYYFRDEEGEVNNDNHEAELKTIPVKIERLDKLFVAVEGMRLNLAMNKISAEDKEIKLLLEKSIEDMEKNIKKLRMISFSEEFQMLPGMIRKMAYDLGKDAEIRFEDNNIEIDRSLFEFIYDPVIHLLKNSVDHGIEKKDVRIKNGKPAKGTIKCRTFREENRLVIEIIDDGRGLDYNKIAEVSGYDISELAKKDNLINILTRPGFTTRRNVSDLSGRGFGLNLVKERILKIPGASLSIETGDGKGLGVRIILPDTFIASKILFTRCRNETLVINEDEIDRIIDPDENAFINDNDGLLYYSEFPVYSTGGRLHVHDKKNLPGKKGIILRRDGLKGCFLVDEILFRQVIPADRFYLLEREVPYLSSLRIAGMDNDLSYLHSTILEY